MTVVLSDKPCPTCKRLLYPTRYCGKCQSFLCRCGRMTGFIGSMCQLCQALVMRGGLVLVTGSRDWTDYARVRDRLARLPEGVTIIEGGQGGADQLAVEAADELGIVIGDAVLARVGQPVLLIVFGASDLVEDARRRRIDVEVMT